MKKSKTVILDGYTTNPGDLSWEEISDLCELTVYDDTKSDEIIERAVNADILVSNRCKYTKEILEQLPNLKCIALLSTGYNLVDVTYTAEKGIVVLNAPHYSTDMVAQHTFALLLEIINQVSQHNTAVKNGDWIKGATNEFKRFPFVELSGKTIGIIGYGAIGRRVASIAQAFNMQVLCFSHSNKADENAVLSSLNYLLANSDIISIHCPYNEQTRHLINNESIKLIKKSAIIINTARGPIIDEAALYTALNNKSILAAGLDVMASEPPLTDNPLLTLDNCIITPHIAWAGKETRARLISLVASNISSFLSGKAVNVVS